MQTKFESAKESLVNICSGFIISFYAQLLILPLCGVESTMNQNFAMCLGFSVVSFIRGYTVRRFFNKKEKK